MTSWDWIKLLHVLAGMFWVGAAIITPLYLLATARAIGPAAGPFMKHVINVRKLPVAFNVAAGLNMLTGLGLYDNLSQHFRHPLVTSFNGWALTLGGLCGVLAFVWGAIVPGPAARRLVALTSKITGTPTPEQAAEIGRLQARLHVGGMIAAMLLVLSLAGMALVHPV